MTAAQGSRFVFETKVKNITDQRGTPWYKSGPCPLNKAMPCAGHVRGMVDFYVGRVNAEPSGVASILIGDFRFMDYILGIHPL